MKQMDHCQSEIVLSHSFFEHHLIFSYCDDNVVFFMFLSACCLQPCTLRKESLTSAESCVWRPSRSGERTERTTDQLQSEFWREYLFLNFSSSLSKLHNKAICWCWEIPNQSAHLVTVLPLGGTVSRYFENAIEHSCASYLFVLQENVSKFNSFNV